MPEISEMGTGVWYLFEPGALSGVLAIDSFGMMHGILV